MQDLVFSSSWNQEVELTRCRISPRLLIPKKSSWRDAGSRLLVFLDPISRVDEMPESRLLVFLDPGIRVDEIPGLSFSPSGTQEDELTRCRILRETQDVAFWPFRTKKGRENEELSRHLGGTVKLPSYSNMSESRANWVCSISTCILVPSFWQEQKCRRLTPKIVSLFRNYQTCVCNTMRNY